MVLGPELDFSRSYYVGQRTGWGHRDITTSTGCIDTERAVFPSGEISAIKTERVLYQHTSQRPTLVTKALNDEDKCQNGTIDIGMNALKINSRYDSSNSCPLPPPA